MARHSFFCIDAHTCGNPVRVVAGGAPPLTGSTMSEKRQYFLEHLDWIRTGLMFEPRGHDMMSGSILYPSTRPDCDAAILYIETSGCLPVCGHGTIGTVTVLIEHGLVTPKQPGQLHLDTPGGPLRVAYEQEGGKVTSVRFTNIPAFLYREDLEVNCPDLGPLTVQVAFGGNFYAIIDPQTNYSGLEALQLQQLLTYSPILREQLNRKAAFVHPLDPTICGLSHILWTGHPQHPEATARNAVFYGEKAIDRSPCGTGTSARMAQWHAQGKLEAGTVFTHESIIGSLFRGTILGETKVGDFPAVIPQIEGWARVTGLNTIFIDDGDPFAKGFQVL